MAEVVAERKREEAGWSAGSLANWFAGLLAREKQNMRAPSD
jgi:hypothetical protein